MARVLSILLASFLVLAGCAEQGPSGRVGADGMPLPKPYKIRTSDTSKIQYRVLDSVNALRTAAGAAPVQLNSQLTAAAATHSRDMSVQQRPWHFGSDGSSPIDRVQRAGYGGTMLGENISETFETEMQTLAAWMDKPGTRQVIMDPKATNMGFSWYQERTGKIWWTLLMGG
ncbi:divisome-associated lipoprotein DalA [Sedimentitalea nanhaiensis]|uniref:Cysteine-rich secretory protein family protein n=1 Tax=Sedimentitalea nanhaiensis TaxID=999627 RepID=A0A1I7DQL1_9RHOB|nr:CAP domain-containing protein [Sedimentitalea nanhaiensis]SFU13991.1 Cysteine-rich secretory protein family protein [Sedimentitalea nanhaiensis]